MPAGTEIGGPKGLEPVADPDRTARVSELYFRRGAARLGLIRLRDGFYASPSAVRSLRIMLRRNKEASSAEGVARLCSVVDDYVGRSAVRRCHD